MQPRVLTFTDSENMSLAAAREVTAVVGRTIDRQGWCALVLSGGSSPGRLYDLLAGPMFAQRIDWTRLHIFWSDERCVGPDDARSNYRLASTRLLEHVPLPSGNIHRMPAEIDPRQAARASERDILSFFRGRVAGSGFVPSFDLVLLGMGADGHVASLFPGQAGVGAAAEALVVATRAPAGMPVSQRLSMSLGLLANARDVFFVVSGPGKSEVLGRVLAGGSKAEQYPAGRINARTRTVWFVAP